MARRVWLFDLDDTLHDASGWVFPALKGAMNAYIQAELGLDEDAAAALRYRYWRRYGATLTGLIRHHGVDMAHFLSETHRLPGLEARLRCHAHDRAALRRLPGRKLLLTNAPRAYAERVLAALGLMHHVERVLSVEDMAFAGHSRPKPDTRMFRVVLARLRLRPTDCVLVEDQLQHQKAARALGLQTVWMQRWMHNKPLGLRPAYVCRRVHSLNALRDF
jgi:putative hydrolase of the HAD superfamily